MDKIQLWKQEVSGYVATRKDLCVDPHRIQAIIEMQPLKDVADAQCLLHLTQYLSKFLPNLSDITKSQRECTQKDSEWIWDHPQQDTLDRLKKAVTSTPVLRYYNICEGITLQCEASNPVWVQL